MNRRWIPIVLLLAFAPGGGAPAGAQVAGGPAWSPHVVVPQSRSYAMGAGPGRSTPLEVAGVTAGVVIRDRLATTMLEIRVRNPGRSRQEAELLVPVPDGAVVRGFSFEGPGPGPEPSARFLPRDEARAAYERIVAQASDPALLEFAGSDLVRSSVFPVEPGGTQAVRLAYEHLLGVDGDRVDYVLPRSESVGDPVPWKVAARITSSAPLAAVYSPSHPLRTIRPGPNSAEVELAPGGGLEPGPFRLCLLRDRGEVSASLFAYPDPHSRVGGGYFLLLAGLPPHSGRPGPAALRREVTIVLDRSGSMRGEKLAQAREAALRVLAGLDDGESFNLILYNESVEPFADRPAVKSASTMAAAAGFLGGMAARGGTNIHDALREALRQPTTEGALPIVLFLTDGLPTIGPTSEAAIRDLARDANPHRRRIFTFGLGVDVNTPLLEKVAYESRAAAAFILPGEDVGAKVAAAFGRLKGPVLADPVLTPGPSCRSPSRVLDLIPGRLPDVFEGDQVVVLGRYTGEAPLEFTLRGVDRGTAREFAIRLPVDRATTRNGFVPRLWAARKIGLLVDAIREQGGAPSPSSAAADPRTRELVDEVVRLSTEFGILTEYTAFLAREGTDFSRPSAIHDQAEGLFRARAIGTRSGLSSVNQDLNNQLQKGMSHINPRNKYLDATMAEVSTAAVQQVGDLAFYKRRDRWVDSRLVAEPPGYRPARVIAFGSEEFRALAARLAAEGRQGSIALRGDILMLLDGQPVLIQAPAADRP